MLNYYELKWGQNLGINKEDIKEALNLIGDVAVETDYNFDVIERAFTELYHNKIAKAI